MKKIALIGINARYYHTSIGLRYIFANLKELQNQAQILEFMINENAQTLAEKILELSPEIIGIGVYIWNAEDVKSLIEIIKKVSPQTKIILGGPEVSHEPFRVNFDDADYIIQGEGDLAFYELCKKILDDNLPSKKIIPPAQISPKELQLPYKYYTDEDVQNRYIYVETSRGCPFLCEFCLSSMDEKVRNFDLETVLSELETLWQRGVRNFKFIDRTFNLDIATAIMLLDFFLAKKEQYFVHFEVIPDHFPHELRERIASFPEGSLQLEIGIQTLDKEIAKNIKRKLNIEKIKENIHFLNTQTKAHLHLDLIVGLPGESLEGFAKNLNELYALTSSEIQIGILKKLSGTTLSRHDIEHGMIYSEKPPYDILKNNLISFKEMQKMKRFARFWDLMYNSGNLKKTVNFLAVNGDIFTNFYNLSDWIYSQTDSTWKISLDRLAKYLFDFLTIVLNIPEKEVKEIMIKDIAKVEGRRIPPFLRDDITPILEKKERATELNKRQSRH
ncbi:MAG: hypothetical protein QG567_1433 [Campylobacterota bacterium]|nr:hypothetical protein [Campylobacterota bacterium]